MTKATLYSVSIFALILTVPWFFFGSSSQTIVGFPVWAFYTVVMSVVYAGVVAFFLGKYWDKSCEKGDES